MKCTGKEWGTCRVEKLGCDGCFYYYHDIEEKEEENEQETCECTKSKSD